MYSEHERVHANQRKVYKIATVSVLLLTSASAMTLSGCLAVAAGAGAGVGYAVGHEQGEDHVSEGVHEDDD